MKGGPCLWIATIVFLVFGLLLSVVGAIGPWVELDVDGVDAARGPVLEWNGSSGVSLNSSIVAWEIVSGVLVFLGFFLGLGALILTAVTTKEWAETPMELIAAAVTVMASMSVCMGVCLFVAMQEEEGYHWHGDWGLILALFGGGCFVFSSLCAASKIKFVDRLGKR